MSTAQSRNYQTPNSQPSPQEAAQELLRRRGARKSLISFTEYTNAAYQAAAHHRLIAEKLEAIERGDIDRLMINMPPRHGKSELGSRRFPAWFLGRNPQATIMSASYNLDKAEEFGGEVRDIVKSAEYRNLFSEVELKEDTRAKGFWRTNQGGYYISAGVGTALTGRGTVGPIVLIDDPLKDRAEADSERHRENVKQWYSSVVLSRFPRAVVVVQTRWHEDDLTGWLLEEQARGGDKWEILELPAISPDGKALWPEFYPIEVLQRLKRSTIPRDWSALYQQRPAPDEGAYFKREWFRHYSETPKHLRIYGASDYAVTEGGGDYTVHLVVGVDPDDNIYVLDLWRGQTTSDVWVQSWLDLVRQHKPLMWVEEQGQIIKSIGPFLEKRMREERVYCRREQVASASDKPTRSRSIQARTSMGKVYLPTKAEWLADFTAELLVFPAGKHDDMVDTFGLIGRMIDELIPASKPKAAATRPASGYARLTEDRGADEWRTL
jgi:predicted phage terminase large subunit-like protein